MQHHDLNYITCLGAVFSIHFCNFDPLHVMRQLANDLGTV